MKSRRVPGRISLQSGGSHKVAATLAVGLGGALLLASCAGASSGSEGAASSPQRGVAKLPAAANNPLL
ncbi:MAG: hypothetical protein ACRDZP_06525, partial [Acidimicrobiales bacterium]